MRTIKINLYKFDELSQEAQEKALEHCRFFWAEHGWWEAMYEDAETVGIKITEFDTGRGNSIKGEAIEDYATIKKLVLENHGKECETYKTVSSHDLRKEGEGQEMFKSLLEDYLILLRKDYEHLTSDECVKELIIDNEYEFTENGEMH